MRLGARLRVVRAAHIDRFSAGTRFFGHRSRARREEGEAQENHRRRRSPNLHSLGASSRGQRSASVTLLDCKFSLEPENMNDPRS